MTDSTDYRNGTDSAQARAAGALPSSCAARVQGVVSEITAERPGIQELIVEAGGVRRTAIAYPQVTGPVSAGDRVLLNTWATSLELGSGGVDFVAAVEHEAQTADPPGHLIKLRYTPLQFPILACEAPESPFHEAIQAFRSLEAAPVVCAELHSQLPAIAAAIHWETGGEARVAYLMTDGAALPIAFSRTVRELRERGFIHATVTAGNAYGGDFEAINLYSGLAVARAAAGADIIIVCQGPGSAGTGTRLGFSGIDQGLALNAAASLGGTAVCVARMSFADPRPRHFGLSHHTLTVLERVVLASVLVPVPRLDSVQQLRWRAMLEDSDLMDRHEFITVDSDQALLELEEHGITLTTMGRGIQEEREFFLSAVAAGLLAGQWAGDGLAGGHHWKEQSDAIRQRR